MTDAAKPDVDPETLSLIRGVLADEAAAPQRSAPASAPPPLPVATEGQGPVAADPMPAQPVRRRLTPRVRLRSVRLPAWRPKAWQVAVLLSTLLLLLRPHWVLLAVLLIAFSILGVFALAGADRTWGWAVSGLRLYLRRYPDRGPRTLARLDRFAERWDRILDRFPDGSVDGLYLPDLQALMRADEAHDSAVAARLDRMRQEA